MKILKQYWVYKKSIGSYAIYHVRFQIVLDVMVYLRVSLKWIVPALHFFLRVGLDQTLEKTKLRIVLKYHNE
jgi:hypothetical protein